MCQLGGTGVMATRNLYLCQIPRFHTKRKIQTPLVAGVVLAEQAWRKLATEAYAPGLEGRPSITSCMNPSVITLTENGRKRGGEEG